MSSTLPLRRSPRLAAKSVPVTAAAPVTPVTPLSPATPLSASARRHAARAVYMTTRAAYLAEFEVYWETLRAQDAAYIASKAAPNDTAVQTRKKAADAAHKAVKISYYAAVDAYEAASAAYIVM